MTSTIQISPIPKNVTEQQIRNQIGNQNVSKVHLFGETAYVILSDHAVLEKLAAKYGDQLRINDWAAHIQPLENFEIPTATTTPSESITYDKLDQTLRKSQNLLGGVVSGVKDLIGSGISSQVGPTVSFKQYNSKMQKVMNILLAIWLICFLN